VAQIELGLNLATTETRSFILMTNETLSLIIQGIVALGALIFSFWQIAINKRLKNLQDYVATAIVPDPRTNKLNLLNTGKINLYLWGFDMPGNKQRFQKPRLIAAGTGDAVYYWIEPPSNVEGEFEIILYLKDEFNHKWVSEHGGRANKFQTDEDGIKKVGIRITVWSYKTYKKKWSL